ncbi:MAG: methylmalonyl Co-A mutase-associated GTPase MeaB [Ignavibacteria bacterium]|nr:methylmalonyl Co-A mutase-associated GTPase MeaB [Ignavibacteria bacterium]
MEKKKRTKVKNLELNDYVEGILQSKIPILARAITLVESNLQEHTKLAQELLSKVIPYSGNSIRIGITGSPGVGKSTFIEKLGLYLCDKGNKVAVLAVDPTSVVSKGSILGDKTRMEQLSKHPNAFIRPSPSGGALGGVGRKTRESIILCEAAGFNVIIVETVGVGQSEILVRSMVDLFALLILPGGGDELQGFKKGTVELADVIIINKADGENYHLAKVTMNEYKQALHYVSNATSGWEPKVLLASSLNGVGIEEFWNIVENFRKVTFESGVFQLRRREQVLDWFYSMVKETVLNSFFSNSKVSEMLQELEEKIFTGKISPSYAVQKLFEELNYEIIDGNK